VSNTQVEQQLAQLLPFLQDLAISAAAKRQLPDDGKEATANSSGGSNSSSTAPLDLLVGVNLITPMPFVPAAVAAPSTPLRQASSSSSSSVQEAPAAPARALGADLSAAATSPASSPNPLQLPQDSSTHALLARGWAYIKAHVPDVPYFIPAGSSRSIALDPSLGLPEVFGDCGIRVFASNTAKHGGKGAFMVAQRNTGITT
jgi:hypothetical protein